MATKNTKRIHSDSRPGSMHLGLTRCGLRLVPALAVTLDRKQVTCPECQQGARAAKKGQG